MNTITNILQDSGNTEWYTPVEIIEAARETMEWISLDPASSNIANETVQAFEYYTAEDDGLTKQWRGHIWMNHPFGRGQNAKWINYLIDQYTQSNVVQACCITFASTSEGWFQPLLAYPQCFIQGRTHYRKPNGETIKQATKGSVVTYLGPNLARFRSAFKHIGMVKV
jgi:hypothetical protein